MSLDFVAIDFETANPQRASVIQIGLARVRNGEIGKVACEFVYPPLGHAAFHPRNIAVHGIKPRDIVGAPYWPSILERLIKFSAGMPLVAHNAAFERSVIEKASLASGVEAPTFEYLCSMKMAQQHLPDAPAFKLDILTTHLDLPAFAHHDAGDDAVACAELVLATARQVGTDDLAVLWPPKKPKSQSNHRRWRS